MKYEMKYDADTQCIVCKVTGQIYLSDLHQYCSDLIHLIKEHNCSRVLNEFTEVDLKLSFLDFFDVPIACTRKEHHVQHTESYRLCQRC